MHKCAHTYTHTHTQAIKKDDYVCSYCGLLAGSDNIKDQPRNGFVMTIMPLDKLPFKTDASLYRSLGMYTYIHTHKHTNIHTYVQTYLHTYIHT